MMQLPAILCMADLLYSRLCSNKCRQVVWHLQTMHGNAFMDGLADLCTHTCATAWLSSLLLWQLILEETTLPPGCISSGLHCPSLRSANCKANAPCLKSMDLKRHPGSNPPPSHCEILDNCQVHIQAISMNKHADSSYNRRDFPIDENAEDCT